MEYIVLAINAILVKNILLAQCDKVARRLRKHDSRARTVVLKIKYGDFKQVTRRHTLDDPTSDGTVLFRGARSLLRALPIDGSRGRGASLAQDGRPATASGWDLCGTIEIPIQEWMKKRSGAPFVWKEGEG